MLWVIKLKKDYKNILMLVTFVFILCMSINVFAAGTAADCTGVFGDDLIGILNKYLYTPIKWATPILLILLTSFDFAKVVFAGKKEEMDKAKNNFLKRFIAAVIIFFAPDILDLIMTLINDRSIASCLSNF